MFQRIIGQIGVNPQFDRCVIGVASLVKPGIGRIHKVVDALIEEFTIVPAEIDETGQGARIIGSDYIVKLVGPG